MVKVVKDACALLAIARVAATHLVCGQGAWVPCENMTLSIDGDWAREHAMYVVRRADRNHRVCLQITPHAHGARTGAWLFEFDGHRLTSARFQD